MFPHALAAARAAGLALLTAALLAACGSDDSPRRRPPSRRARAWWSHSIGLLFLLLMSPVGQAVAQTIYAIKPDPEIAAICASEDGLTAMWAREPAPNKADIRFQYEGVKAQADAAAKAPPAEEEGRAPPIAPVPLTFEEYRDAVMAQRCKIARDGIVETFERAMPFFGFSLWECDANWNQDCDDEKIIRVPEGYQICNVSYRTTKQRGDSDLKITPNGFLPDKPSRVARFIEYRTKLYAHGSFSIFDKEGSRIRLENFLVTMLPQDWPDDARRKLKCEVPSRPAPPANLPTTDPPPKPVRPILSEVRADDKRSYRFSLANIGKVPVRVEYLVERMDQGDLSWKRAGWGIEQIEVGTTYLSDGYHGWDAVEWRTRFAVIQ